jgi:hypothetical protein
MAASAIKGATAFDSDSKQVAIDNCSSRSLTTLRKDFVPGTIQKCNVAVSGVGGQIRRKIKGTVRWTFEDDQGRPNNCLLPNTPMSEALPHRLLSPQHWAQEVEKGIRLPLLGAQQPGCTTNADSTVLTWGKGKLTKTVPLHPEKNVAIMSTKAGIKKYSTFVTKIEDLQPKIYCFAATGTPEPSVVEVTDDEPNADDEKSVNSSSTTAQDKDEERQEGEPPTQANFQDQPNMRGVSIKRDKPLDDDSAKCYRLHVHSGHLSFSKVRAMARRGDISSRLQHCVSLVCGACQYGKATRKPWRTKQKNRAVKVTTFAEECVLVDQTPMRAVGLVAQMKGRLTHGRYTVAAIFVDHFSRLGYVHLQKNASSGETLKAKRAYELYARDCGIKIRHYHANIGRFADNGRMPLGGEARHYVLWRQRSLVKQHRGTQDTGPDGTKQDNAPSR